jgi:hypothetical protein
VGKKITSFFVSIMCNSNQHTPLKTHTRLSRQTKTKAQERHLLCLEVLTHRLASTSVYFFHSRTDICLGIFFRTRRFLFFTFVFFVHVYRYKTEQLNSCTFGQVPWLDQVIRNNHSWDPMFINRFCAAPLRGALCCETPSPVVCVCVYVCVRYFWRQLRMLS